jgi:hypothetical protein
MKGQQNQMSQENQNNAATLEWLYENKSYENTKGVFFYKENEGKCAAVHNFMLGMAVRDYHNDK